MTDLAQGVEDVVEEQQYLPFCYLGNVVHALASIVPDSCVLVCEACKDWGDDCLEVACDILLYSGQHLATLRFAASNTY